MSRRYVEISIRIFYINGHGYTTGVRRLWRVWYGLCGARLSTDGSRNALSKRPPVGHHQSIPATYGFEFSIEGKNTMPWHSNLKYKYASKKKKNRITRFASTEIYCQDEHYYRSSNENGSNRIFFIDTFRIRLDRFILKICTFPKWSFLIIKYKSAVNNENWWKLFNNVKTDAIFYFLFFYFFYNIQPGAELNKTKCVCLERIPRKNQKTKHIQTVLNSYGKFAVICDYVDHSVYTDCECVCIPTRRGVNRNCDRVFCRSWIERW